MKEVFHEEQKFRQWFVWILLIGITLIPLVGLYQQLILKKPFGNNPMSDNGLILFAFSMLALLFLFCDESHSVKLPLYDGAHQ